LQVFRDALAKILSSGPEVKLTWVLVLAAGNNSFKTGGKEVDCCKKCLGTGRISCGACWGGQRNVICPDCMGKGWDKESICQRCHGTGRIIPQSCPFCGNSSPCPDCGNAI
jgi:DnaJ-class molecular chaperone with C-terminal Zn finger domain